MAAKMELVVSLYSAARYFFEMKNKIPQRFLVIRFRQMGDAVLATALLNAIKLNFPDSQTDFVLNQRLAPLFEGHPAIDRIITFTDDERHSPLVYLRKIWRVMRNGKYDVIIDLRSTVNTLPFSLSSPFSRFRIGVKKPYTRFILNHRIHECGETTDMASHDVSMLSPLEAVRHLNLPVDFSLHVTDGELASYRQYLRECGVDFDRPVLLCGVVSKLRHKTWRCDYMVKVLRHVIDTFPGLQLIFNYAPGDEERESRSIYKELGEPSGVFIDVKAEDMRRLVCLASCSDGYFGNEGGARHIAHAVGCPSLVVVSPWVNRNHWLPKNSVYASGIAVSDVISTPPDNQPLYDCISPDYVAARLDSFIREHVLARRRSVNPC